MREVRDLLRGRPLAVLTGAGVSTESGIPDYRGESGRKRPANPMTIKQFLSSPDKRRYYWARSAVGWPWIRDREPNRAHQLLSKLESMEYLTGLITQNVDDLHGKAGSRNMVELHGNLRRVICLSCGAREDREDVQERMMEANPGWRDLAAGWAPDGDALIDEERTAGFLSPSCLRCGGDIKPDVVFFGENANKELVRRAYQMVDQADTLLILGSSLTVRSGLRFAEHAARGQKPVVIVNQGPTRADGLAHSRFDAPLGDWLEDFVGGLAATP
jgi:NAD-dependent SIR2 family protein deacetylase